MSFVKSKVLRRQQVGYKADNYDKNKNNCNNNDNNYDKNGNDHNIYDTFIETIIISILIRITIKIRINLDPNHQIRGLNITPQSLGKFNQYRPIPHVNLVQTKAMNS